MTKSYSCLGCGEDIRIPEDCLTTKNDTARCPRCSVEYVIDYDAEFEDGVWRDKTKLHEL